MNSELRRFLLISPFGVAMTWERGALSAGLVVGVLHKDFITREKRRKFARIVTRVTLQLHVLAII